MARRGCYDIGGGQSCERPSFRASQSLPLSPGCLDLDGPWSVPSPVFPWQKCCGLSALCPGIWDLSIPPGISNFETGDRLVSSSLEWGEDTTGFSFCYCSFKSIWIRFLLVYCGCGRISFEELLMFKENGPLWSIGEVREARSRVKENEKTDRTKKRRLRTR